MMLTPRADRLRELYRVKRRITDEIARLKKSEAETPLPITTHWTCGTNSGYHRHRRDQEPPCERCKVAHCEAEKISYRRRREAS